MAEIKGKKKRDAWYGLSTFNRSLKKMGTKRVQEPPTGATENTWMDRSICRWGLLICLSFKFRGSRSTYGDRILLLELQNLVGRNWEVLLLVWGSTPFGPGSTGKYSGKYSVLIIKQS